MKSLSKLYKVFVVKYAGRTQLMIFYNTETNMFAQDIIYYVCVLSSNFHKFDTALNKTTLPKLFISSHLN